MVQREGLKYNNRFGWNSVKRMNFVTGKESNNVRKL